MRKILFVGAVLLGILGNTTQALAQYATVQVPVTYLLDSPNGSTQIDPRQYPGIYCPPPQETAFGGYQSHCKMVSRGYYEGGETVVRRAPSPSSLELVIGAVIGGTQVRPRAYDQGYGQRRMICHHFHDYQGYAHDECHPL